MKGDISQSNFSPNCFATRQKNYPFHSQKNERGLLLKNVFEEIRNMVAMSDVAKFYGLQISHSGMACCPFHNDNKPSMKIYEDKEG